MTDSQTPMPLRVPVFQGEPAHGLFHRLATRNGFANGPDFARRIGLSWPAIQAGRCTDKVAQLAGCDEVSLAASSPSLHAKSRKAELNGHQISLGDWRSKPRRVCRVCLANDENNDPGNELPRNVCGYHRSLWDVWSITHCPVHGCRLTERCPRCAVTLSWEDPAVGVCACSYRLAGHVPRSAGQGVSNYLAGLLQTGQTSVGHNLEFSNYIDAARNLQLLGQVAISGCTGRLSRRDFEQRCKARQYGFDIAQALEREFPKLLDAKANLRGTGHGLLAGYGWVYSQWAYLDGHMHPKMRTVLWQHAVSNGVISPLEARLGAKPRKRTKSLVQVAQLWGCSFETAKREVCRQGRLPSGSRRSVATTITKAKAPKKISGTRALGLRWSIGRRLVQELVSLGHLLQNRQGICPDSVAKFEKQLFRKLSNNAPGEQHLPIVVAARLRNISLASILHAIVIGHVSGYRTTGVECSNWITKIEVDPKTITRSNDSPLPIKEAGQQLGLHHEAVHQFVKAGLIERADGRGLCPHSVKAFENQYIALGELAKEACVTPLAKRKLLARIGIVPAFDRPKFRQIVFARADLSGHA